MSANDGSAPDGQAPRQSAAWVDADATAGGSRVGDARLTAPPPTPGW
jgi:hypothetical protein